MATQATQSVASATLADDDGQGWIQRWRRGTGWVGRIVPLLSVIVFLAIWQIVGSRINPILLATPTATARAFWDLLVNGELGPAFATAMGDLAAGFALAAIVGIGFGIVLGRSQLAERVMNPYINFFQATPLIALVPLVVIWFGVGFEARVAVTFLLAVWSILINTATGVKNAPAALRDVGRVYKFSPRQVVMSIELPSAVPSIFAGLRIALGKALIGMVIAQMEISVTGIGGLVVNYGNAFRTAYLLAAIVTASAVGVVAAILLELFRRWLFPWTEGEDIGRW